MANPQKENGHIQLANEIVEKLAKTHLSSAEWRVLLFIIRKTWGWGKKSDWISLSQFVLATNLQRPHICRAINMLIRQGIITKRGTPTKPMFIFHKDFDQWRPLPKGVRSHHTSAKGGNEVVPKGVIGGVPKGAHTKESITKEINTKGRQLLKERLIQLRKLK